MAGILQRLLLGDYVNLYHGDQVQNRADLIFVAGLKRG
jgi:hypothetical protein